MITEGPAGWWRGGWQGPRMQRGDLSPIIIHLLSEKPMHGYEIIRTLEERSHGFWRPSPGSIYPTLQLLEEQGLVESSEQDGKKIYALTEAGRTSGKGKPFGPPWADRYKTGLRLHDIGDPLRRIMGVFKRIVAEGSDEQITEVKRLLTEVADRLEKIAAEMKEK